MTPTTPEGACRCREVQAGTRSYLKLNRTHTDRNSSREIPRYIFTLFFLSKLKINFFFLSSFLFLLFYFISKFPTTPPLLLNVHFHRFLQFFNQEKFFFFSFSLSFFLFLFYFLFFFFSYFLLRSSITPLLLLNLHFHYTITLQKKKRSAIFKPYFIYISKIFCVCFGFCF